MDVKLRTLTLSDLTTPSDLERVIPPEEARKIIAKEILKSMVIEKYRKEREND